MISDGQDPNGVVYAGMSATGSDVFFQTRTQLVGQDTDSLGDIYDARIGGGFPAPSPEASCSGEACQGGASSSPAFGASGTSSFTAGGNVTPGSTSFLPPSEESKLTILSHTVKKRTLTLKVAVPAAGKLTATGKGLAKASKTAGGRGTVTLTLKAKGHGKLNTNVKLTFAPTKGRKLEATVAAKFKG
jgi:hypothetical protein